MKNTHKIISILLLFLVIVSCDEDDRGPGFNQNLDAGFVEISPMATSAETIIVGNSAAPDQIFVPLFLNSTFNTADLQVQFMISPVSGAMPSDVLTIPTEGIIPAGSRVGNIEFGVSPNINNILTENLVFDVILTGSSRFPVGLPDDSRNLTHRVTIAPINIRDQYAGTAFLGGFNSGDFTVDLVPFDDNGNGTLDDDAFILATTWGPGLQATTTYPTIIRLNREDFTITVEGTDPTPNPNFQPDDGTADVILRPFNSPLQYPGPIPLALLPEDGDGNPGPNPSSYNAVTDTFSFSLTQFQFNGAITDEEINGETVNVISFPSVTVTLTGINP